VRTTAAILLALAAAVTVPVQTASAAGGHSPTPSSTPSSTTSAGVSSTRHGHRDLNAITIGDSVQLGARWQLLHRGITIVDAMKNRQASAGPALLAKHGSSLPHNVVIDLGTNGPYDLSICQHMVRQAGPSRQVFLMTVAVPRRWEKPNNAIIRQCADSFHAAWVHVIDWHRLADEHQDWLYADHTHLKPAGAKGYATLITQAITAVNSGSVKGTS